MSWTAGSSVGSCLPKGLISTAPKPLAARNWSWSARTAVLTAPPDHHHRTPGRYSMLGDLNSAGEMLLAVGAAAWVAGDPFTVSTVALSTAATERENPLRRRALGRCVIS